MLRCELLSGAQTFLPLEDPSCPCLHLFAETYACRRGFGWSSGKRSNLHLGFSRGCKAAIIAAFVQSFRQQARRATEVKAKSEAQPLLRRHPSLNVACRIQGRSCPPTDRTRHTLFCPDNVKLSQSTRCRRPTCSPPIWLLTQTVCVAKGQHLQHST